MDDPVDLLALWLHDRYCGCGFYCDTRRSGSWHEDAQHLLDHLKETPVRLPWSPIIKIPATPSPPKPTRPDPSIPETRKHRRSEPGHWVACAICAVISFYTTPWVMAAWLIASLAADFDHGWNRKETK